MNDHFKLWLGQVTTGHGFMILASTILALLSGTMSWEIAVPLLAAAGAGLLWPENTQLKATAETLATDVMAAISAYRNPPPGPTAAGMVVLVAAAIAMTA